MEPDKKEPILFDQYTRPISYKGASGNHGQDAPAPLVKPPYAPRDEKNPGQKREKTKDAWDRVSIIVNIIATFAALGVLYVYKRQLGEMIKTTDLIKSQLAESMDDRRAWLGPERPKVTGTLQETNPAISLPFRNYGRTPAMNIQYILAWSDNLENIPKEPMDPNKVDAVSGIISPGINFEVHQQMPVLYQRELQTNYAIFFFVEVIYDDIFGNHHWTSVCYRVPQDLNLMFAKDRNSCDDEENVKKQKTIPAYSEDSRAPSASQPPPKPN